MSKGKLAVVTLNHGGKLYRLNTITISKDGSIHIIIKPDSNTKGTYHPSGFRHFTEGVGDGKEEVFPKMLRKHMDVSDSQGLMNFSVKDVNGDGVLGFTEFIDRGKYKNLIKIDSANYVDLTVRYFIAGKKFDTSSSLDFYKEVFEIELENHKLIIATHNTKTTEELMSLYLRV
jgi:hypothetical protein